MAFVPKTQAFNASINAVTLGTGEKTITIGGENVLPLYTFDAPIVHAPKVGVVISDLLLEHVSAPGIVAFYEGCNTMAEMVKKASTMQGASFICLNFEGADPNGMDKSVQDCVALATEAANATDMPIVVMGCKNIEKDTALFAGISEALTGKNIAVLSAREENYKAVGVSSGVAYGQKIGAESAVDINLAKQLNVMLSQLGVSADSILMNAGGAAAGYGFEYVASTFDRIKSAALAQNDAMLQMPIITPVSTETWGVKEAVMPEADMPEWGNTETRGIQMEITTASACLTSGSNAVILAHPVSVATIAKFISQLI